MPEGFTAGDTALQAKQTVGEGEEEEDEIGYQKPDIKQIKHQNLLRRHWKKLAAVAALIIFYYEGAFIKRNVTHGIVKYIGWADEPTYMLSFLSVAANIEADPRNFILLGGVPKLLRIAKESTNEEARMGALVVLHTISSNPYTRREICEVNPTFVSDLLGLLSGEINNSNKTTVSAGMNVLYNYLGDKQWFYAQFMQLKGFDLLLKLMKSPEPEIGNFASQLVGLFIMENVDWFKEQRFKDTNAVFTALANMAAVYQDAGKSEYALKAYQCIMHIDNKNPMILTQMGLEMLKVGQEEEGIKLLRKSLEINPKQLEAAFGLAKYTLTADTSVVNLKTAINVLLQGLPELKRVNTQQFQDGKHPLAPKVYNFLVNLYLKIGDLDAALEMAQDWAAYAVADPNALATTGKILLLQGEYREALAPLGAALRLNPRMPQTHFYRAMCLSKIGRDDLALGVCEEGIQVDTELWHSGEQRCAYEKGRAEQAIKQAEYYAYDEKKVKDAERIIAEANRAQREKHEISVPLYLLGGKLYSKAQKFDKAIDCYDTVIKASPANVKAYLQKAQTLKLMGAPTSRIYSAYTAGFMNWLELEKSKRSNELKTNDKTKLVPKAQAAKAKKEKSAPEKVSGNRAILLKAYQRCQSGGTTEGLKERTEMCKVVQDLTMQLQLK